MKKLKFICGAILLVLSIHGIVHAASATLAQGLYAQAKYGSLNDDATAVLRRCKSAHSLYPHNYNLCILAARTAFVDHFGSDTEKTQEEASLWCKEGLRLNPYRIEFRLLKTRLLQKKSLQEAISYWEEYVDWHYWSPGNHALLTELYAEAGNFSKAMQSLKLIKGTKFYKPASDKLNAAWQKEKSAIQL